MSETRKKLPLSFHVGTAIGGILWVAGCWWLSTLFDCTHKEQFFVVLFTTVCSRIEDQLRYRREETRDE
jgi:hypothetical protein